MEQLIVIVQKRADLDAADFRKAWTGRCAELAKAIPGLRKYRQNPVIDTAQRAPHAREADEIDAFAQLWFDDRAALDAALASDAFRKAGESLKEIAAAATVFTCRTQEVVNEPTPLSVPKRMTLLFGKPGMPLSEFEHHWFGLHAEMVAAFPDIRLYYQHLVTGALDSVIPGLPDTGIRCEGVLEMKFDTVERMDWAFTTDQAKATIEHGGLFLRGANIYLVDEIRQVA